MYSSIQVVCQITNAFGIYRSLYRFVSFMVLRQLHMRKLKISEASRSDWVGMRLFPGCIHGPPHEASLFHVAYWGEIGVPFPHGDNFKSYKELEENSLLSQVLSFHISYRLIMAYHFDPPKSPLCHPENCHFTRPLVGFGNATLQFGTCWSTKKTRAAARGQPEFCITKLKRMSMGNLQYW